MPYTEQIEKFLRRKKYAPATADELAAGLGVPEEHFESFKATLQALEYAGKVARVKGSRYTFPGRAGLAIGNLDIAKAGFGFVVPLDKAKHRQDIFISPHDLGSATEGDLVAASILKKRGRFGQPAGKIEYVIKRHRVNFVGTFEAADAGDTVFVDGNSAIREINVTGFEGVSPQSGEKVVVEIRSWARAPGRPSGVVVEVLGSAAEAATDTIAVIREFDLPCEFPEEVLREAEEIADTIGPDDLEGRLDLRKRTVITIDPVHSRDFDDAFSIKRTADGWLLGVHIADVSKYVPPGSQLDAEAAHRSTSVYLPTRVIPMLPHSISNGIASLREDEDRLTKTVILRYNRKGELLGYELHKSIIRSVKRMTYEQASAVLAGDKPEDIGFSPQVESLLNEAAELAKTLEKRRLAAGLLELDMPEVDIELDGDGEVTAVVPVKRDWSHKLIEMFMVASNEVVAEFMTERNLPHIRRVHEGPSPEDLQGLKSFLAGMGIVIRDTSDRFQIQEILKRAQGRPESPVINLAVLKSMRRAEYSPELKGHFALASKHYSHYTSPIRRYPDLVIHQILDEYLTGRLDADRRAWWDVRLPQITLASSQLERRAESAERELTKLKILRYLEKDPSGEFDGIISGVKPFGIFIELSKFLVDGFVHVSRLPGGPLRFDPRGQRLAGKKRGSSFRLGDAVVVTIAAIDLASRKLDLDLVRKIKRKKRDST
ncbi:MAG: ribonuclease R [Planctomycetes bacterium]|nr:ribonuclease R [Planctomycetota bacterium]